MSTESYKDLLNRIYLEKNSQKPSYSLRAFARDIGLPISSLSMILAGKQGLSLHKAKQLLARLNLNPEEQSFFLLSVQGLHARSAKKKQIAQKELNEKVHVLKASEFNHISEWYYFAIMELTALEGFKSDVKWIAAKLGLQEKVTKLAIEHLLQHRYLIQDKEGGLTQSAGLMTTESVPPSASIRKFHSQILKKADSAIYTQENTKRDLSALMMGFDPEDIPWVKEELKKFRRTLMKRVRVRTKKKSLYCLSMQFFDLTENLTTKTKGEIK